MSLAVEDIVNIALDRLGYPKHIADIYEGSTAAKVALEIYAETRDSLLAEGDWPFALREATLVASGQTPPNPWQAEFLYPADCLRIRYIRPGTLTGGTRSNDPKPVLFRPFNDARVNPPIRAILCELNTAAVLIYNGQVTDPNVWESGFSDALIADLADKMSFLLSESEATGKAAVDLAATATREAMKVDDLSAPKSGAG